MKRFIPIFLLAALAAPAGGEPPEAAACPAPAPTAKDPPKTKAGQFDPLVIDLNGDKRKAAGSGSSDGASGGDGAGGSKKSLEPTVRPSTGSGIAITEEGGPNQHADKPKRKGLEATSVRVDCHSAARGRGRVGVRSGRVIPKH